VNIKKIKADAAERERPASHKPAFQIGGTAFALCQVHTHSFDVIDIDSVRHPPGVIGFLLSLCWNFAPWN
jgi:hypothetical protein